MLPEYECKLIDFDFNVVLFQLYNIYIPRDIFKLITIINVIAAVDSCSLVPLERFGPTMPTTTGQALRIYHALFAQGYRALMLLCSEITAVQFFWMLYSSVVILAVSLCCLIKPCIEFLSVMRLWHPRTLFI